VAPSSEASIAGGCIASGCALSDGVALSDGAASLDGPSAGIDGVLHPALATVAAHSAAIESDRVARRINGSFTGGI
jgi:hypothetical protein